MPTTTPTTTTTIAAPRTALYARVSTTGHRQDVGLQLDELRQDARQRGWNVVAEHVDDGVSGAATSRPALDRLMEAARRGQLDLVVIWKLDRLGRSLQHLLAVLDELQHLGVGFVSIRDSGIDTTSASGRLLLHLLGAFAAYERDLIKERVLAGVRRAQHTCQPHEIDNIFHNLRHTLPAKTLNAPSPSPKCAPARAGPAAAAWPRASKIALHRRQTLVAGRTGGSPRHGGG